MANEQEKLLKDAQYRKGLSIAFFNATNGAVEIIKLEGLKTELFKKTKAVKGKSKSKAKPKKEINQLEVRLQLWRNWLIKEHAEYYAKVIAPVGDNFKPEEGIAKLIAVTTLPELRKVWVSLSQDERDNKEILKVAQELRRKYNE